jgi:DNA binding domain, excisionase family
MTEKLLYSVKEAGVALGGLSRAYVYALIKNQEIATVHIGRRVFVRADDLERYVRSLKRTTGKGERQKQQRKLRAV